MKRQIQTLTTRKRKLHKPASSCLIIPNHDQNKMSMIAKRRRSRLSFTAYSGHGKTGQARGTFSNKVSQLLLTTTLTISGCYITIDDKSKCQSWFEEIKHIWKDKDVIIVEGTTTHNGVGNDLFDLTRSVCRIIAPPKNAYDRLDEIYDECLKQDTAKDKLFLVTLGPAAKKLVYKLYKSGHRAIDIGQLDMEYEMYLMKATKKVPIFKHRIVGDKANREAGYDKYLGEIIRTIK